MARWKPIESAPKDRSILVCGGTIETDLSSPEPMTEAVKVEYASKNDWWAVDYCYYSVTVHNPTHWQKLPEPMGYDL